MLCEKLQIYNTYSMAGSCYLAHTAPRPRGSTPQARDCISHIALPAMLYLLHTCRLFLLPCACARGIVIGSTVIVVHTKITRVSDRCHKHVGNGKKK